MPSSVPIELSPMGRHAGPSTTSLPPPYAEDGSDTRRDALPGGLGRGYIKAAERARATAYPQEDAMDSASVFGLAAAGWFATLALPLLVLPRLVLFLAQGSESGSPSGALKTGPLGKLTDGPVPLFDRGHYDSLTSLESFLLRMLGLGLLALAALVVFTVVPRYTPASPARKTAITVIALLECVSAVVAWNAPLGALAVFVGMGNGLIGAWGWWALFFGEETHKFKKYLKEDSRLKRL